MLGLKYRSEPKQMSGGTQHTAIAEAMQTTGSELCLAIEGAGRQQLIFSPD